MNTLYIVLPLALSIASAAVLAFAWVVRSGQLDDVDTPPRRILFDDDGSTVSTKKTSGLESPDVVRTPG